VVRTPYDKSAGIALTEKDYFPPRGYVVVIQDTRGRHASGGEFNPFVDEARDGYDAIEWAAVLPSSSGMVGTVGQSFLGLVQYFAATQRPPHLKAMSPVSGPVTYFENFAYRHGAFELGWVLCYFAFMARDTLMRKGIYDRERPGLDRFVSYHPDGAAQARRLYASAAQGLGRAAQGRGAVSGELAAPFDLRLVLGRARLTHQV
jgi:putative CocE/NonD family hydrolase